MFKQVAWLGEDAGVGAEAPGFRATWQSKDHLKQQVMQIDDVPSNAKLQFWDGEAWVSWDSSVDLPGPEGDPLRIKVVCPVSSGIFAFVLCLQCC